MGERLWPPCASAPGDTAGPPGRLGSFAPVTPGNTAVRHQPHGLHQTFDLAGADALDVSPLHHRAPCVSRPRSMRRAPRSESPAFAAATTWVAPVCLAFMYTPTCRSVIALPGTVVPQSRTQAPESCAGQPAKVVVVDRSRSLSAHTRGHYPEAGVFHPRYADGAAERRQE